ncbi:hypothetical protein [Nocardiopsis sp. FR26]|uniref:hypothetical protein n=1 Tax=Nocardiopsis sp. FR26 TaxID=2605987 RepID=UPI00135742E0|nr:hypothetical protein [Nocardiopsis sp. FR26]
MPNGKLTVYEVTVNGGFKTKMQLTEDEARKRGLIPDEPTDTKPTGRRTKTATTKEGDK